MNIKRFSFLVCLTIGTGLVLGVTGCGTGDDSAGTADMDHSAHDHEAMLAEQAAMSEQPEHDHAAMLAEQAAMADHSDHDSMTAPDSMAMEGDGVMMDHDHSAVEHAGMDLEMTSAGTSGDVVSIEPAVIQTIGVRTMPVEVRSLSREIRSTGRFEMDESGAHMVTVRTPGWVEALYVNYEGALVEQGQPLLDLYSPDLVATQEEYLLAYRNARRMSASPIDGMAADADRLLAAAKRRLLLWELRRPRSQSSRAPGLPCARSVSTYRPAEK
jgi:hypothetical protein